MAGSNYEVNIKLDLKQAKDQLKVLEDRITKLNRMALSGKASRQAAQANREKLKISNLELKNDLALLKVKQNELKLDKQSFQLEKQKANAISKQTTGRGGSVTGGGVVGGGNKGKGGGVLSSALISGSFPLLFGQGLAGGAFGALGGGLGAKFGGQMGGFAGGLVATAALQIFNNTKDAINQFGAELNDPSANLDKLIVRIKDFDRSIVTSAATLKNAGLDQVAGELASLTLEQRFGTAGTDALKGFNNELSKFAQRTKDLGTQLSILVAGPLTLFFKLLNTGRKDVEAANKDITTSQATTKQQNKLDEDLAKRDKLTSELNRLETINADIEEAIKDITSDILSGESTKGTRNLRFDLQRGRFDREQEIENAKKELEATKNSIKVNERLLEIRKIEKEVLASSQKIILDQIALENVKIGIARGDLDEKALSVEQKRLDIAKASRKVLTAELNLRSLINNPKSTEAQKEIAKEKLKNLATELNLVTLIADARIRAADPRLSRIDELNREMLTLTDIQRQAVELSKTMGTSFEEAFKGIISGTMSTNDAFRNMLNSIANHFRDTAAKILANQLQRSLLGLLGNVLGGSLINAFGGGSSVFDSPGVNSALDNPFVLPKFADGGRPPVGRASIVGERGPELFVPDRAGTIVPNNAMGGSTNIVINVDASGSSVEGDEGQANNLGNALATAIQAELINQKRAGGLLSNQ